MEYEARLLYKASVAVVLAGLFGVLLGCPSNESANGSEVGTALDTASFDSSSGETGGEVDVPGIQQCSPSVFPEWPGAWWNSESALDVEFSDGYVYLPMGRAGLAILQVASDGAYLPASTVMIDGFLREVEVAGGIAVLTGHRAGLLTYDVTGPAKPQQLGQLNFCSDYWPGLTTGAGFLALEGSLAFVDAESGVFIVDISDPKLPKKLSYVELPADCTALSVYDNVLYAASYDRGFIAIDVSTPTAPRILGRSEDFWPTTFKDDSGWGMKVSRNVGLFIANNHAQSAETGPLAVVDLSNPQGPFNFAMVENSETYSGSTLNAVELYGDLAIGSFDGLFINGKWKSGGLCVFGIEDPSAPQGSYCTVTEGGYAFAMAAGELGRYHVVKDEGLSHVTLQSSSSDAVLARYPLNGKVEQMTMGEQGIHVVTTNGYLLSFGSPTDGMDKPSARVALPEECDPRDAVERDGTLYLACVDEGILAYDTTTAAEPALLYALALEAEASVLAATDELLIVGNDEQFIFLELTDGTAPQKVAEHPSDFSYVSLRASGNLLAVNHWPEAGAGGLGWTILDVSDPLSPEVVTGEPIMGGGHIVISPPYIISRLGSMDGPTVVSVHEFWPSSGVELVDQFPLDMDVSDMALSGGTLALLVVDPEDTSDRRVRLIELAAPHNEGDWSDIPLPDVGSPWTIEEFDGTIAVSSKYAGVGFLELAPFL
jgi:hypothetical protein